ncbi:LysR substrate-binding domain-containing protein [Streptomyces sp. NPDC050842]|uniref:LysR substrate-binding domain-containing protein n=1 Tax=Streptomyces sp. NPDC050842 TaxID=3365636 RepID=UPI0037A4577D
MVIVQPDGAGVDVLHEELPEALTPVGRRLREDLQQAHDLLRAGLARAEAAGLGAGRIRLGVIGTLGYELRPRLDAFRSRYPGSDVQFTEVVGSDPFTSLRTGETDVNVLWPPVAEPDLTVGPTMATGGRVLAVPAEHPPAVRDTVSPEDLADDQVAAPLWPPTSPVTTGPHSARDRGRRSAFRTGNSRDAAG